MWCLLASAGCLCGQVPDCVSAMDLETALESVCQYFGTRVGLEHRITTTRTIRFPSQAKTGLAAVASIVRQAAGYRWRFKDGVAHVYDPGAVRDPRNWLNMPWQDDFSRHAMPTRMLSTILMQGVEARVRHGALGGARGGSFIGFQEEPRLKLQIRRGAVREYLNEFIKVSEARMWVVRFSDPPILTRAGFFEVACASPGRLNLWTLAGMRPGHGPYVVKHPIVLRRMQAAYSEKAKRLRTEGTVVLWVDVAPTGKPANVRVLRPLGHGLDENAIIAVQNWRFMPPVERGKPVAMRTTVEVDFRVP